MIIFYWPVMISDQNSIPMSTSVLAFVTLFNLLVQDSNSKPATYLHVHAPENSKGGCFRRIARSWILNTGAAPSIGGDSLNQEPENFPRLKSSHTFETWSKSEAKEVPQGSIRPSVKKSSHTFEAGPRSGAKIGPQGPKRPSVKKSSHTFETGPRSGAKIGPQGPKSPSVKKSFNTFKTGPKSGAKIGPQGPKRPPVKKSSHTFETAKEWSKNRTTRTKKTLCQKVLPYIWNRTK